jgi:hypothetical protein
MKNWVWWLLVASSGCYVGPSEEQLSCYQGCGREKDSCMLEAATAAQIQGCDVVGQRCSKGCQ